MTTIKNPKPAQTKKKEPDDHRFDRELEDLPLALRWRQWMFRIEAVLFASTEPLNREVLARVVGSSCSIELLIDDLREDLRGRPYDVVYVAGGWQFRSRPAYAETIRAAPVRGCSPKLSNYETTVLASIAYQQPVTRADLSKLFGKEVSRDTIAALRDAGLITSGPRSPKPGAPYTYVTTQHFLSQFGLATLSELPNIEALEEAGLKQQ